jgi:hypothetical protein
MALINWTNVTALSQIPDLANTSSGGTFWPATLIMIFIILVIVLIGFGFEVALMAAAFVTLIIALLLAYVGLVAWTFVLIFMALLLIMFLYVTYSQRTR